MTPRHKVEPVRHSRHFSFPTLDPTRKKRAIIALNIAVLLVLVGGTAAYGALSKTVTVKLDGRSDTVRTFSDSVKGVLASKDVKLHPDDKVNVDKSGAVTDGDTIKVDFAKPVTVAVDGSARGGTVHDNTVGDVLDRYEVDPADDAYVSVSRSARIPRGGMQIVVSNPKKITVKADDDSKSFTSAAPRVEDALKKADVRLDKDDEVSPGRGALVSEGDEIAVTRIEMIDKTETVDVKPPVEYKDDDDMEKGTTKVLEDGKPGKARENVLITKADGEDAQPARADVRRSSRSRSRRSSPAAPPRPRPSPTAASGTRSPSASPVATGTSTPATATTADSSSAPPRGTASADQDSRTSTAARRRSSTPRSCRSAPAGASGAAPTRGTDTSSAPRSR